MRVSSDWQVSLSKVSFVQRPVHGVLAVHFPASLRIAQLRSYSASSLKSWISSIAVLTVLSTSDFRSLSIPPFLTLCNLQSSPALIFAAGKSVRANFHLACFCERQIDSFTDSIGGVSHSRVKGAH